MNPRDLPYPRAGGVYRHTDRGLELETVPDAEPSLAEPAADAPAATDAPAPAEPEPKVRPQGGRASKTKE